VFRLSEEVVIPMGFRSMRFVGCCLFALQSFAGGCAHHRAQSTYAYAPPYAPPVYPQPYGAAQPVAYTAPAGTVVGGAVPAGAVMAAPVVSGVGPAGTVVTQGVPPCPPMAGATLVGASAGTTTLVGDSQTPPCPPTH